MKVILIENVADLGKKYEIKEVKPGYARNFLIPNNLAKLATKDNLRWLKEQQATMSQQMEEDLKVSQAMASKLEGLEVTITVKVGPEGQLFESINAAKIAEQLKSMDIDVKKSQINLKEALKNTGEFPVKIALDHNLEAEINLIINGEAE